jgi:AcrR family transcriptional regulator
VKPIDNEPAKTDVALVREKSSQRKGRTSQVVRSARIPTQERSKKRYQSILDATLHILQSTDIENISLHDIGKVAELPPPSVHYLFNTVTSIFIVLNKNFNSYLTEFILEHSRNQGFAHVNSWQELTRSAMTIAKEQLNSNRAMSEIMLGPVMHRSMRLTNLETNRYHGSASLALFDQFFVVPDAPKLATYLMYAAEIADGLWAGAYSRFGKIDDETFEESVRACIAYLRCYFPENMQARNV